MSSPSQFSAWRRPPDLAQSVDHRCRPGVEWGEGLLDVRTRAARDMKFSYWIASALMAGHNCGGVLRSQVARGLARVRSAIMKLRAGLGVDTIGSNRRLCRNRRHHGMVGALNLSAEGQHYRRTAASRAGRTGLRHLHCRQRRHRHDRGAGSWRIKFLSDAAISRRLRRVLHDSGSGHSASHNVVRAKRPFWGNRQRNGMAWSVRHDESSSLAKGTTSTRDAGQGNRESLPIPILARFGLGGEG